MTNIKINELTNETAKTLYNKSFNDLNEEEKNEHSQIMDTIYRERKNEAVSFKEFMDYAIQERLNLLAESVTRWNKNT